MLQVLRFGEREPGLIEAAASGSRLVRRAHLAQVLVRLVVLIEEDRQIQAPELEVCAGRIGDAINRPLHVIESASEFPTSEPGHAPIEPRPSRRRPLVKHDREPPDEVIKLGKVPVEIAHPVQLRIPGADLPDDVKGREPFGFGRRLVGHIRDVLDQTSHVRGKPAWDDVWNLVAGGEAT